MYSRPFTLSAVGLLMLLVSTSGCISLAANLIGVMKGNTRPADYEGLEGQRVALICTSDDGLAEGAVSSMMSSYIHANFNTNIDDIEMVRDSEVARWLDSHDLSEEAYVDIGKGVEADKVVAVEVLNVSLKNGATLFKGKADVTVTVYDTAGDGGIVYRRHLPEFTYPNMGGPSIVDTSETRFRGLFLDVLADKVSGLFYPVDVAENFALDAKSNSF